MERVLVVNEPTENVFCATGPGGGVDPTCPAGGKTLTKEQLRAEAEKVRIQVGEEEQKQFADYMAGRISEEEFVGGNPLELEGVVLYHGTSEEAATLIARDGLIPSRGPGADESTGKSSVYKLGDREASVFMTNDLGEAAGYANRAGKFMESSGMIVKIVVPEEHAGRILPDEKSFSKSLEGKVQRSFSAVRIVGSIPPEWVAEIETVEGALTPTGNALSSTVYGVLLIKKSPTSNSDRTYVTNDFTENVFCATGPGGGVDPTCTKGGKGQPEDGPGGTASKQVEEAFGHSGQVRFTTDDSGKAYGEHGSDGAVVVNPQLATGRPVSVNFKTAPGVTEAHHLAAHELVHQVYSNDSGVGREMMDRLSKVQGPYGSSVSMYGALSGQFENLIELGAVYAHSPTQLKEFSPEMFEIAQDWASRSKTSRQRT